MKRHPKLLIDLGSATAATKGAIGFYSDDVLKRETPGISAD
jgi:hypothetical protein